MSDTAVQKKKLLIMVPSLHQGGQERVVVRTSRLLEPYFDITIAIFDGSDVGYDVSGLKITDIDVPAKPGKVNKIVNILKRTSRIKKLKKDLRPDITYSYGPSANIINSLSAAAGELTWTGLRNYTDATDKGKMKLCVKHSDLIICCARDIETEVHKLYGSGVLTAVLYNLYDMDGIREDSMKELPDEAWFEAFGLDHDGNYVSRGSEQGADAVSSRPQHIMSMGRADDQKMFWHMLKIFKLIREKNKNVFLTILGAGDWDMYAKLADELGIAEAVYFTGPQLNPYKYLRFGDINLMTTRNEGFPNALVEGMALSMAAVSTNCLTGPAEILVDGGDCFSAREQFDKLKEDGEPAVIYGDYGLLTPEMARDRNMDPADIPEEDVNMADVVLKLLADDAELAHYKAQAAKRAMDFTYEAYLDKFLSLAGIK